MSFYLKLISLLIPILFGISFQSIAQSIDGRVTDSNTGEPLAGASILEVGTTNGTSTDADGEFSLRLRESGYEIQVSFIGYRTETVSFSESDSYLNIELTSQPVTAGEVFVNALRVDDSTPVAYSNISREEIDIRNTGQDIPMLVSTSPSVVSASDAGAGIGYTNMRIRGVDQARINVTVNGIPMNDSESHGVFWVNMPDFASSTQNIQIQRGVGTSTHGASAFGATMNLQSALMRPDAYGDVGLGVGAYGTQKATVQLGSGLMDNGWQVEGRLSKIESDGYIDRAESDLRSFYLSASRHGDRSLLKADVFSGQERTYQAWNGVPEPILENNPNQLENYITNLFIGPGEADRLRDNLDNRQFNEFTYEDQVDNYQQDHYQLHYSYRLTDNWTTNTSLHYTYGRGYFEQYRQSDDLETYNINPVEIGGETIEQSDLVRRRWLDNDFYGVIASSEYRRDKEWSLIVGGAYNEYDGDHFGEVIWAEFAGDSQPGDRYYDNTGFKTDFNVYGKLNYYFSSSFNTYIDLQYRAVTYRFLGLRIDGNSGEVNDLTQRDRISFFNPKAGIVYRFADGQRAFASLSVGGKEPTRRDYVESTEESRPDPERLYDYELGYHGDFGRYSLGLNLYYMLYKDQLITTGEVNDVGNTVRENVPDSYRTGIEIQLGARITDYLQWNGNMTFSRNKVNEYEYFLDDFDQGGQERFLFEDVDIAMSPAIIANSILTYRSGGFRTEWISKFVSRQYLDNTQTESRSIDPYWLNDLVIRYSWDSAPFVRSLTASLTVNNILNEKYVANGYTFGWISGNEQRHFNYYYPQAERHAMFNLNIGF
ncbi:MAG: TonB-dependent receptor [Rhodohalobacter sp.]|uniref:TonB-dependent receptor n=1 Tax=Rhodohalobacter sp. TaxID=1974210 RepID=UPI0039762FF4